MGPITIKDGPPASAPLPNEGAPPPKNPGDPSSVPVPADDLSQSIQSQSMDKHLVTGIAWTAATKWSGQILSWATLLIIAHLLSPSDFGIVGMATIYLGLLQIFSEFGFGSAVVTLQNLQESEISQINTLSVASGVLGFLISCAVAKPLGLFFHSAVLPGVVVAMSTGFIIAGFRTVPYSLLLREFRFKNLSVANTAAALIQSICVLVLAWIGFRYWSLVVGNIAFALALTSLNIAWRPHRFSWPRMQSIRTALNFSGQLLVARLSSTFYSDSDFLVAGRMLGAESLGAYTFAWTLATLPVEKITSLVSQVTPAFFSATQTDPAELRRYLRTLTEALSLITFPAAIGLGLVAPAFVNLALGKAWSGAILPLQILAVYASVRSITALFGPLLTALRETRAMMWTNLAGAAIMPTAFFIGSHWGSAGIACGWVAAYPLFALPLYGRALRRIEMHPRAYFAAIWPAASGSLSMVLPVLILRHFLPDVCPLFVRLAAEIVCGGLMYFAVLLTFHSDRVRALMLFLRTARSAPAAGSA